MSDVSQVHGAGKGPFAWADEVLEMARADGSLDWGPVLPFLRQGFTNHVRDRGSRARNAEDHDRPLERIDRGRR